MTQRVLIRVKVRLSPTFLFMAHETENFVCSCIETFCVDSLVNTRLDDALHIVWTLSIHIFMSAEGEVCLLCPDGNSGCFSDKLANHYCCGCDPTASRCTACASANLCVENSGSGLKWECKSPTVTLIVLSIMGGVLLAFVLLIILAFVWHRRKRSVDASQQQSANGAAPTEDDALLSFRADSTLGIYHAWPPTAVNASISQVQPTTDALTSQDPAISS
eukprot:TRINITY_DN949_c0_g1_i5.p1 TRINITY_DN949_c0_g1~~TRINITY_DN949_c0_g1_i5.p1  ORF type:complete len:219 (+),score=11.79 TRINITY_DN949_c0_g1_i5:212-868(+)